MFSGFSSTTDPLRTWRTRFLALVAGATCLLLPTVAWALRELPRSERHLSANEPEMATVRSLGEVAMVDRSVFDRNLWWELPKSSQTTDTAQVPKPAVLSIEVDLIGVITIDGALVAALYDRRANRLLLLRHGETIADAEVSELTNDRVTLSRGDGQLVLVRRRPGP